MPDQDVVNEQATTGKASNGQSQSPPFGAPANGRSVAEAEPSGQATSLHDEFAVRVTESWARFASVADELRHAADAMQDDGRPPSYRLIQMLGDCHREFLRLRRDLSRRAETLGTKVPPSDAIAGIADLIHLVGPPPSHEPPHVSAPEPIEAHQAEVAPEEEPTPVPAVASLVEELPAEPVVEVVEPTLYEAALHEDASQPVAIEPFFESPQPWLPAAHDQQTSVVEFEPTPEPLHVEEPELSITHEPEPVASVPVEPPDQEPAEPIDRAALDAVEACLRLVPRDGKAFPPLDECLAKVQALHSTIVNTPRVDWPAEVTLLETGEHAINALLSVVSGIEGLSDTQWANLHTLITDAYGRQLAVAAARNRLVMSPS